MDDWFAEHTLVDFVERVRGWLRDAARDRLIRREDGFEPTRLEESLGYAVYDPVVLNARVHESWKATDGRAGFCFLWYELLGDSTDDPLVGSKTYALRLMAPVAPEQATKLLKITKAANALHTEDRPIDRLLFGILAWPDRRRTHRSYTTELPEQLDELVDWGDATGIPIRAALDSYLTNGLHLFGGVPVTTMLRRPQRLIGTRSRFEPLNFALNAGGQHSPKDGELDIKAPVYRMGHRKPLTAARARELSSFARNERLGRLLLLGAGAIGSKLAFHLLRSGESHLTIVDYDELSPHNLVRHALYPTNLGKNKAESIAEIGRRIYYADPTSRISHHVCSGLELLIGAKRAVLDEHDWLIDTTASSMIRRVVGDVSLPRTIRYCRMEIADKGRLGILTVEGPDRNPRVDDLQAVLFDLALENPDLSRWLRENRQAREEEVGSTLEEISIGISCSSETMRLADEVVSWHSASFATGLRQTLRASGTGQSGRLVISRHRSEGSILGLVQSTDVGCFTVVQARNERTWSVRLGPGVSVGMRQLLRDARPNETGGLLVGMVNFSGKTVYVTRIVPPPRDSVGSPYAFRRGVQDVPEEVSKIQERTGGMLGYVGEWHTHPAGGPDLSPTDRRAVAALKRQLDKIPLPTVVVIVTSRGLYPHVFPSDGNHVLAALN